MAADNAPALRRDCGRRRARARSPPARALGSRPLARRCRRPGQSARAMPVSKAARLELPESGSAQGRDRSTGIDELVAAGEPRPRQVEQPVLVLIDEAAALLVDGEILRADEDGFAPIRLGARLRARRRRAG